MSEWIDFKEIKSAVSLEMVLRHYNVELRRVGPTNLRGKCPLPTHASDKSTASFTVNLAKGPRGVWVCKSHSCVAARNGKEGGNLLDLVSVMEACSVRDAALKLAAWFALTPGREPREPKREPSETEEPVQLVSKEPPQSLELVNKPLTFTLQGVDFTHPYLKSRGVDEGTARLFGSGYFGGRGTMAGRMVIPIHDGAGQVVAYAGRSLDDSEPKYKFPTGFHKSVELFNLHRVLGDAAHPHLRRVVVVEGFFDCVKVVEAGYPCVALMGNSLSETQAALLLKHFTSACILLDGDAAGRDGTAKCVSRLTRGMWVYSPPVAEGKQPDELSVEELHLLVKK